MHSSDSHNPVDTRQIGANLSNRHWPRATAEVDLGAIEHNARRLRERAGQAELCAVVKADGYGHGAADAARAALGGGATRLAVATTAEARTLRDAGLRDVPILVLGPLTPADVVGARELEVEVVAWSPELVGWLGADQRAHLKLDTGMGRHGTRSPAVARAIADALGPRLAGVMTHFATADAGDAQFAQQLARFAQWAPALRAAAGGGAPPVLHAANSAATLRTDTAHFDLVRCGLALYGMDPMGDDARRHGLRPALRLVSHVASIARRQAGEPIGYGARFRCPRATRIGTVPVGYADGLDRRLGGRGFVEVRGRRRPIVGAVSMDVLTVDLGPGDDAALGDEAVLVGGSLTAEAIAAQLDTIPYEITTQLTGRVVRRPGRAAD